MTEGNSRNERLREGGSRARCGNHGSKGRGTVGNSPHLHRTYAQLQPIQFSLLSFTAPSPSPKPGLLGFRRNRQCIRNSGLKKITNHGPSQHARAGDRAQGGFAVCCVCCLSARVHSLRYTGLVLCTSGSTERKTDTLHFQVTP